MKVKLSVNNCFLRFGCVLCGEPYDAGEAKAVLHHDDNKRIGDICPRCIEAGPGGVKDRIKKCVEYHQSRMEWLQDILNRDLGLPTVEEWHKFEEECAEYWRNAE